MEHQISFMEKNGYHFSYANYEEIDEQDKPLGVKVTGPKKVSKRGMYNYCYPGCLTVMYDAEYIGLVQIKDIKRIMTMQCGSRFVRKQTAGYWMSV